MLLLDPFVENKLSFQDANSSCYSCLNFCAVFMLYFQIDNSASQFAINGWSISGMHACTFRLDRPQTCLKFLALAFCCFCSNLFFNFPETWSGHCGLLIRYSIRLRLVSKNFLHSDQWDDWFVHLICNNQRCQKIKRSTTSLWWRHAHVKATWHHHVPLTVNNQKTNKKK